MRRDVSKPYADQLNGRSFRGGNASSDVSQNGLTMSFSPQSIEEGATTQDIGVSVRSDNNDKSIEGIEADGTFHEGSSLTYTAT